MNEQDFAELSAGHALGALSPADEQAYRDALQAHPEWQHIVDADQDAAGFLGDSIAPVAPPLAARSQIMARIRAAEAPGLSDASEQASDADSMTDADWHTRADTVMTEEASLRAAAPPTEVVQAIERRNWTRGVFALVASIALLVGIGVGVGTLSDVINTPPAVKTLAQIEAAPDAQSASGELGEDGEATLHWSETLGEAVLVASGLPDIDADRTFELWFVRGDAPISAGTFDASDGDATTLLAGGLQPGDIVAVTVEQQGGSPEGAPTTDPIVAIASDQS